MHYDFVQNPSCEYFLCHRGLADEAFNCLFCYCPLYALGRDCGGSFTYENAAGVKDCSACTLPHIRSNYPTIIQKLGDLVERVKQEERQRITQAKNGMD
jgi:Zn-finger protein